LDFPVDEMDKSNSPVVMIIHIWYDPYL